MLVKQLKTIQELLSEITGIEPTPTPTPGPDPEPTPGPDPEPTPSPTDRCKYRHEDEIGTLDKEFVGKLNDEWQGIDYLNNYKAYPSGKYYDTTNPGQNKYGVYYEDMPEAVANPASCEPGPEEYGSTQADLNWLLFNNQNRGRVSGVKNASELYELLAANHRITKFKDSPNGIQVIKTNELTIV